MRTVDIKCPACNGSYDGRLVGRFITCEYCGTRYALSAEELAVLGIAEGDGGFEGEDPEVALGEDNGFEPMDAFARDACAALKKAVRDDYFESTDKIMRGLGIESGHEVYLIHDDTMFKSGKNGFAITSAGLYCREMGDGKSHFVSWSDFANDERPEQDNSYIRQGGTSVCYFSDNNDVLEDNLVPLYLRLHRHARKVS